VIRSRHGYLTQQSAARLTTVNSGYRHHTCMLHRPVVKSTDDTSNFEEYKLGPMTHLFKLSEAEQAMFEGI
jgi:hypothetical protein